jgi:hypothetical protein
MGARGVIVRMVMARTPPPTIRRSRLFGLWRHALFAEWLINRHQHARTIRAMVLVHNFGSPRTASIGIVHSSMHMKRVARSTATSGSTLQLRVARRFWNR